MSLSRKKFTTEMTTGFGERSNQSGGRFYNKDGKPNTVRKGINFLDQLSWYHTMLSMAQWKFWSWLLGGYIFINSLFGIAYFLIGVDQLSGAQKGNHWQNF